MAAFTIPLAARLSMSVSNQLRKRMAFGRDIALPDLFTVLTEAVAKQHPSTIENPEQFRALNDLRNCLDTAGRLIKAIQE